MNDFLAIRVSTVRQTIHLGIETNAGSNLKKGTELQTAFAYPISVSVLVADVNLGYNGRVIRGLAIDIGVNRALEFRRDEYVVDLAVSGRGIIAGGGAVDQQFRHNLKALFARLAIVVADGYDIFQTLGQFDKALGLF